MRVAISGAQGFLSWIHCGCSAYSRGGKIGLVGGVGIGRRGVILKVINNIAKTHAGSLVLIGKLKTYSAAICTATNLSG